jgi:hypothetical protein
VLDEAIDSVVTGKDFNLLQIESRVKYILTLGQVLKMNWRIYWCSGKLSRYHRKIVAEQDLINSNKLLDESQDVEREVGVEI